MNPANAFRVIAATLLLTASLGAGAATAAPLTLEPAPPMTGPAGTALPVDSGTGSSTTDLVDLLESLSGIYRCHPGTICA